MKVFNPEVNKIYLDMDGPLADFDGFIKENLGFVPNQNGPANYELDSRMWNFIKGVDHFYLQLKPTKGSDMLVLWAQCMTHNVEILTAIPRVTPIEHAEKDKIAWITQHFVNASFDPPVNFGPYSADKWKWCKPGDILIDDRVSNINEWKQAGGIGILFTNYDSIRPILVEAIQEVFFTGRFTYEHEGD